MGKAYGQLFLALLAAMPACYLSQRLHAGEVGQWVFSGMALAAHYFINKDKR